MNTQQYLLQKRIAEEATTLDLLVLNYDTRDKIALMRHKIHTVRGDCREKPR